MITIWANKSSYIDFKSMVKKCLFISINPHLIEYESLIIRSIVGLNSHWMRLIVTRLFVSNFNASSVMLEVLNQIRQQNLVENLIRPDTRKVEASSSKGGSCCMKVNFMSQMASTLLESVLQ